MYVGVETKAVHACYNEKYKKISMGFCLIRFALL